MRGETESGCEKRMGVRGGREKVGVRGRERVCVRRRERERGVKVGRERRESGV